MDNELLRQTCLQTTPHPLKKEASGTIFLMLIKTHTYITYETTKKILVAQNCINNIRSTLQRMRKKEDTVTAVGRRSWDGRSV